MLGPARALHRSLKPTHTRPPTEDKVQILEIWGTFSFTSLYHPKFTQREKQANNGLCVHLQNLARIARH